MDKVEKIRAEIERRIKRENEILWNARKRGTYPSPSCEYILLTLTSLRDFLVTLSEEPDKDLEKEIDKVFFSQNFEDDHGRFSVQLSTEQFSDIARHFAQWGAEHLRDSTKMIGKDLEKAAREYAILPMDVGDRKICIDKCKRNAFIAGAKWQRARQNQLKQ